MENKDLSFYRNKTISGKIKKDSALIKEIFIKDGMLRTRSIKIAGKYDCRIFFSDGMANSELISEGIVKPLLKVKEDGNFVPDANRITESVLYSGEASVTDDLAEMISGIIYGDTLLIIDGETRAVVINTKGFKIRSVTEPPNERVQKGPREGFCESVLTNVSLIRRKLQTPDFCCEPVLCGRRSGTRVYLCYLDSLVNKSTLSDIKGKIKAIDIDGILDTNYISEKITAKRKSLFKTAGSTERPDVVAARLLEGRIAVLCDGSPSVLTVPFLFSENFQSDDDYYLNFFLATIGRHFRLFAFFAACFLTGIYVSLVTFHAGLLPTASALAVLRLRVGVPFSTLVESLVLIFAFEILKEACSKAPRDSGTALSVVGGLVIGEAAVNTQTISAPTLIIVALSGICTVMVPRIRTPVFFINIVSTLAGGLFGLFGVFSVGVAVILFLLRLDSFGVDYTESLKEISFASFKDVLMRGSWSDMITRPPFNKDKIRQKK